MRSNRLGFSLVLVLVVGLLMGIRPGHAVAAEQRCGELGAACICSEPFNTDKYPGGPDFWNPADSTSKECSVEAAVPGGAIVRTANTIRGSNEAPAVAALPAGHGVQFFVRAEDNHEGTFSAGHGLPVSASLVRLAARFYIYHSPVFDYNDEATCRNSKQVELNGDSRIDLHSFGFQTYNYLKFSPPIDCCVSGPAVIQPDIQRFKGRWVRHEIVLTNRSGPRYRLQSFIKNVTDNTPEVPVIDLALDPRVNNLTPPMLMSQILSNNHRWSNGTICRGWLGLSHYMMAGWTSDAGQRIGKASEIEGGGGAPAPASPPAAPTNPRISLSDPQMLLSGFSPIVLVGTVAGLVLVRRKRRP